MTRYTTIPGRILAALHARCPHGGTVQLGVRALAAAVGCSPGSITPALRTLEADGYIRRIPAGPGTLIEVISPADHDADRRDAPGDQSADRQPDQLADRNTPDQIADHAETVLSDAPNDDSTENQVETGCMEDHDSWKQHEQHAHACDLGMATEHPLYQPLIAAGATEAVASAIIAACPERIPAELARALAANERRYNRGRTETPNGLVFALWKAGKRLQEELHDRAGADLRRTKRGGRVAAVAPPEYWTNGGWSLAETFQLPPGTVTDFGW